MSSLDKAARLFAAGVSAGTASRAPQIVAALPEMGQTGVTYLVPNGGTAPNVYDEYIWIPDGAGGGSYELMGQRDIDLSGYVRQEAGKGLSANDFTNALKSKLEGIPPDATSNAGTVTGITMNGVSKGTGGVVDLGTVLTEHQDISGKVDKTAQAETDAAQNQRITDLEAENAALRNLIEHIDAPIYLTPASGNPVTFSDAAAANVKELVVTLTPSQSAAPSVESPVPIDGYSSVAVRRSGKNLVLPSYNSLTTVNDEGRISFEATRVLAFNEIASANLKAGKTYTISVSGLIVGRVLWEGVLVGQIRCREYDPSKPSDPTPWVQTPSASGRISIRYISDGGGFPSSGIFPTPYSVALGIQIEEGEEASAFVPYAGDDEITVPFVDSANNGATLTVYGGVLTLTPTPLPLPSRTAVSQTTTAKSSRTAGLAPPAVRRTGPADAFRHRTGHRYGYRNFRRRMPKASAV